MIIQYNINPTIINPSAKTQLLIHPKVFKTYNKGNNIIIAAGIGIRIIKRTMKIMNIIIKPTNSTLPNRFNRLSVTKSITAAIFNLHPPL